MSASNGWFVYAASSVIDVKTAPTSSLREYALSVLEAATTSGAESCSLIRVGPKPQPRSVSSSLSGPVVRGLYSTLNVSEV